MKTTRAHYDDPLHLRDTVLVLAHGEFQGAASLVLERTIFYPESGGQLGDHGSIGDLSVIDTQIDADGLVHHIVAGERPAVGALLDAAVDEARRRSHMALHTGQHAFSRALLDQLGATTLSSRLGASACTLDVDVPKLTLPLLRPVQDAVNRLIDEDRPVRQRFVEDAELEGLELRKPPPDTERVRVVEIEGWDTTPCGGTHATHTAQIELFFIQNVESYKGGSRITFEAGPRARAVLLEHAEGLRSSASKLRCAVPEVPGIIDGTQTKLATAREEAGALRLQLAERWATQLSRDAGQRIIASIEGGDPALLQVIATRLGMGDRFVALAAPSPDGQHVLLSRGPECGIACGEVLKAVANASGGRGGGRPGMARGRIPADVDFVALVRAQLDG